MLHITCILQCDISISLQASSENHIKKKRKHNHSVRFSKRNQEHFFESDDIATLPTENAHQVSELHPNKLEKLKHKAENDEDSCVKSEASSSGKGAAKPERVAADLVVKYLTPAFKEGRIASKVST